MKLPDRKATDRYATSSRARGAIWCNSERSDMLLCFSDVRKKKLYPSLSPVCHSSLALPQM